MRSAILVVGVIWCVLVAAPLGQQKDAAAVLIEMRQALGGAAVLDAVKTFSISGSRTLDTPVGSRRLGLEWLAMLPDHFLEIERDSPTGPVAIDITYYRGIAGSRPINKTQSTIPFPETRYVDNSPEAIAARERARWLHRAQAYARIMLVFTGGSPSLYPLQFTYVGVEQAEGKTYDVIDARGSDGFTCRLHVDTATHLPAMLTWLEELPYVMTSTSVVTTTSVVRVPSGTPMPVSPPLPPPPTPTASQAPAAKRGVGPRRWLFNDFKAQDGIIWPRVINEDFDGKSEEIRLGRVKINPKIDAKKFDIK